VFEMSTKLPEYKGLPLKKGDPKGSAWGLWGKDDQLGTLNLLTDTAVQNAAKVVKDGKRISLNWEINSPISPFVNRLSLVHKVWQKAPRIVNDDEISLNTQSSTHIVGLRHFGFQIEKKFYGGVTEKEILASDSKSLGIQNIAQAGIVGRGILIDYALYREKIGKPVNPGTAHAISADELLKAAKSQGVTDFQPGDILLIRTGYIPFLSGLKAGDVEKYIGHGLPNAIGLEQSEEVLSFLWNNHFAMVASDALALEVQPPVTGRDLMHSTIIAGWGMSIGKLWDLEELSRYCEQKGRYSFCLTAAPLNISGGVGSPANALAFL